MHYAENGRAVLDGPRVVYPSRAVEEGRAAALLNPPELTVPNPYRARLTAGLTDNEYSLLVKQANNWDSGYVGVPLWNRGTLADRARSIASLANLRGAEVFTILPPMLEAKIHNVSRLVVTRSGRCMLYRLSGGRVTRQLALDTHGPLPTFDELLAAMGEGEK